MIGFPVMYAIRGIIGIRSGQFRLVQIQSGQSKVKFGQLRSCQVMSRPDQVRYGHVKDRSGQVKVR